MRLIDSLQVSSRSSLLQVFKTSVAAIVSWLLCVTALGQPLPIFAAIAALLVVQPSVNQSLAKGVERSAGVIAGVILAYLAGRFFGHASWIVLGIIVISLLVAWALRLSPGSANQIPISAMLVLAIGANTPDYAVNRIIETIIGAAIGLIVNVIIVPPVLLWPAQKAVGALGASVSSTLESLAVALRNPQTTAELNIMLEHARTLRTLQSRADAALQRADESLTLNPRRNKYRGTLEHTRRLNTKLGVLVTRVVGMARALHDRYEPELATDPLADRIATELDRAAHDLLLLIRPITLSEQARDATTPATVTEVPTLTAPLVVLRPQADNWILVGSLLEDLRRVREEIVEVHE